MMIDDNLLYGQLLEVIQLLYHSHVSYRMLWLININTRQLQDLQLEYDATILYL